jgi:copper chaperone CopZ
MKSCRLLALSVALFAVPALATAGDVQIKGVHLCCGACVTGATAALKPVEGLSAVAIDRDSKSIGFTATDDKAADAGIKALADAGFFGTATHGGKALAFPASGAKDGAAADTVTLTGVHLCCGACVTGAQRAVQGVKGVTTIDIDLKERTVKLVGKEIKETDAVAALAAAGFYGKVKN